MKLLKEEKVHLQGWSIFSNIERPHAAIIMRDPIDAVIKGVRYQIIPAEENGNVNAHKFTFETWAYKARGPIEHQTFLSFYLRNRFRYDPKVAKYMSHLRVLNKHLNETEANVLATVKFASAVIDHINFDEHFDVYHMLSAFKLIAEEDYISTRATAIEAEKMTSY